MNAVQKSSDNKH